MRRTVGILVGLCLAIASTPLGASASVGDDGDASTQRAAREIADAREQANAAADALFEAESQIDRLELEQQDLVREIAGLQAEIAVLQSKVEGVAVDRFTRAGSDVIPLLTGFEQAGELAQVDVLIDVVNQTSAETFDDFDQVSAALADAQQALNDKEAQTIAAREEFERRRTAAIAEVARLKEVEADRLANDAIRRALEAEEAERRRREDELRKAQAAAAADAVVTPSNAGNSSSRPTGSGPTAGGSGQTEPDSTEGPDGDAGDAGPVAGGTGGAGGGQTGNGGIGGRSGVFDASIDYGSVDWVCPVQGVVFFGDTWGAPRSGGRLHQGVDMLAQQGVPLVAVVDGYVQQKTNELGGKVVWLTGTDGNKYYYADLDRWEASGAVGAGTVIGYVGQSGNAVFSVPHLHFQIHPSGGVAVNPYQTVRAHC